MSKTTTTTTTTYYSIVPEIIIESEQMPGLHAPRCK